jgi:tRNA A37 methylthiotransferase MiaB
MFASAMRAVVSGSILSTAFEFNTDKVLNAALVGKTVEILVEGLSGERWYGRTRTNKLVFFKDNSQWQGLLAQVKIEKGGPWWLLGKVDVTLENPQ